MIATIREMPNGVLIFMGYCFVVLTAIGLTLPLVIDQAVSAPITFVGLVVMLLLAYLIFTMTMLLQRKQAAYLLSMGLVTLLLPFALVVLFAPGGYVLTIASAILFVVVVWSLRRPHSRAWFSEA